MRSKTETSLALSEFIQEVGCPREILSDWGTEFFGRFSTQCTDRGIKVVRSCPYTAWQNGLVEAKNRRLKEVSRKLLIHSGLGPELWGHAIMTACYLLNRKATEHAGWRSPYEALFGYKPEVSHLRVFGSTAYCFIQKQFRDPFKHKQTCSTGIFVGYDRQSSGYLVYFPKLKKVMVRRDVWFDEHWRMASVDVHGVPHDVYVHPALSDADQPVPSGYLISGGVVRVPAESARTGNLSTLADNAPGRVPTPRLRAGEWMREPHAVSACIDRPGLPVPPHCTESIIDPAVPTQTLSTSGVSRPSWHIEFFCGTSSSLRYHLQRDPDCHVLAVDLLDEDTVRSYVPEHFRDRFHFVQSDMLSFAYSDLQRELEARGAMLDDVRSVHASPSCVTYSLAHHAANPHRRSDGWRSETAIRDDMVLEHTCALLQCIGEHHSSILQSMENPLCMFADMPCVQALAGQRGWQLVRELHHCMMTSSLDTDYFPNKPSTWLLFNCAPQSDIQCFNRCANRLPHKDASTYHRVLVCNRPSKHPEQIVLTDPLEKARIPLGLFAHLQALHEQVSVRERTGTDADGVDAAAKVSPSVETSCDHKLPPKRISKKLTLAADDMQTPMLATGVRAQAEYINKRVQVIHGLTYAQAVDTVQVPCNRSPGSRTYRHSDYMWDIKHGYISHAAITREALPSERRAAHAEMMESFETACLTSAGHEPQTRRQAMRSADWDIPGGWRVRELEEMLSLIKMGVLRYVPLSEVPTGTRLITTKPVYKEKPDMPGVPGRRKVRLTIRGFVEGKDDYGCVWAPVTRHETCRAFYARLASTNLCSRSVDIKSAFLTAPLSRPVYIKCPEGYEKEGYCCRVDKACYGLCDAPRAFYLDFRNYLRKTMQVHEVDGDPCLYKSQNPKYPSVWVLQYVDDLQLQGSKSDLDAFVAELQQKYELRDYGETQAFIGMEVNRNGNKVCLTQSKYIEQMADRFNLLDAHYVSTPMEVSLLTAYDGSPLAADPSLYRSMVGSLMYAACLTQPGLMYAVMALSRHLSKPTETHMSAARRAIAWVYHHRQLGITYDGDVAPELVGYSDANYAACTDTRRSTSGRVFMLCGGAISWASHMQRVVATSTAESEYMAVSDSAHECIYLRKVVAALFELKADERARPTIIWEDNEACKKWCENPEHHAKQKHIDVAYHFVREQQTEFKTLRVEKIDGTENPADLGTKPLPAPAFEKHLRVMMNLGDRSLRKTLPDLPAKNAQACKQASSTTAPPVVVQSKENNTALQQAQSLLRELAQLTSTPRSDAVVRPRDKEHFTFEHRPNVPLPADERGC